MKFLVFAMFDVAKATEMAQVNDKLAEMPGRKVLSNYTCMGLAFPGVPLNTLVTVSVVEYESSQAMAAVLYQPFGPCLYWRCQWVAMQQQKKNSESDF